jgi:transcription elongation factor Elf1
METGEHLRLQEIETSLAQLKLCPKCSSNRGFWTIMKGDHIFVQCKCCGVELGLCETYKIDQRDAKSKWLKLFRK